MSAMLSERLSTGDAVALIREQLNLLCEDSLEHSLAVTLSIPPEYRGHVDAMFVKIDAALAVLAERAELADALEAERDHYFKVANDGWQAHADDEARVGELEDALREADGDLVNAISEASHGLTASNQFIDRCVARAHERLRAALAAGSTERPQEYNEWDTQVRGAAVERTQE